MTFQVVGVHYRLANFTEAGVKVGDSLMFVPEPENPHDKNAVAVYKQGLHIGYVPRAMTEDLGSVRQGVVSSAWKRGCVVETANAV